MRSYESVLFNCPHNAPNSTSAQAPSQAPLGELIALPQTLSRILGILLWSKERGQKRKQKGRKGVKKKRKKTEKGQSPQFTFLATPMDYPRILENNHIYKNLNKKCKI